MNEKVLTWIFGGIIGWISFETLESVIYSLLIAFLGGVAATFGKMLCNYIVRCVKQKKIKPNSNEKTTG